MTDQPMQNQLKQDNDNFMFVVAGAMLIAFGVTMLLLSVAYVKDVALLRDAPQAVWDFICGRPNQNGTTLPLLLTIGTLTILGGAGALAWVRFRKS